MNTPQGISFNINVIATSDHEAWATGKFDTKNQSDATLTKPILDLQAPSCPDAAQCSSALLTCSVSVVSAARYPI